MPSKIRILSGGVLMAGKSVDEKLKAVWEAIKELQGARGAAITVPADDNKPRPLKQLGRNPWAIALVSSFLSSGLVVAVISHVSGDLNARIDARIEKSLSDRHYDEITTSVHTMEGQLKSLAEDVKILLGKSIKQAASLSSPEFRRQLPQIDAILNAAREARIPPDPTAIKGIQDKLTPFVLQRDSEAWQGIVSLASYNSTFRDNPFAKFAVRPVDNLVGTPSSACKSPQARAPQIYSLHAKRYLRTREQFTR